MVLQTVLNLKLMSSLLSCTRLMSHPHASNDHTHEPLRLPPSLACAEMYNQESFNSLVRKATVSFVVLEVLTTATLGAYKALDTVSASTTYGGYAPRTSHYALRTTQYAICNMQHALCTMCASTTHAHMHARAHAPAQAGRWTGRRTGSCSRLID